MEIMNGCETSSGKTDIKKSINSPVRGSTHPARLLSLTNSVRMLRSIETKNSFFAQVGLLLLDFFGWKLLLFLKQQKMKKRGKKVSHGGSF